MLRLMRSEPAPLARPTPATLEGIAATLDAQADRLDTLHEDVCRLGARVGTNEVEIARLQEQGTLRSAGLAGLSVILATIAGWLGISR